MGSRMEMTFDALAENEAFARMAVSAFLMRANPTMSALCEVRTAVSEAVTNAVVHAYGEDGGSIVLRAAIDEEGVAVEVEDFGRGIEDIARAMEPFYTTKPQEERTGMGFALMQSFMDEVRVRSAPEKGTLVRMRKGLKG